MDIHTYLQILNEEKWPKIHPPKWDVDIKVPDPKEFESFRDPEVRDLLSKMFPGPGSKPSIPKSLAVGVLVSALIAIGYKIYKARFSKYARKCKGTSGEQRRNCVKAARNQAMKERIAKMQQNKKLCAKSKDQKKCVSKIDMEINKLKRTL